MILQFFDGLGVRILGAEDCQVVAGIVDLDDSGYVDFQDEATTGKNRSIEEGIYNHIYTDMPVAADPWHCHRLIPLDDKITPISIMNVSILLNTHLDMKL